MTTRSENPTQPFVPYPYDKLPKAEIRIALETWRANNRVSDSQMMLVVKNGPDKQSLCDCSPVINQRKREKENTLVPVIFCTGQSVLQEDVRVYLSEVVILEDPGFIIFSGNLQANFSDRLLKVHGEYNGNSRRGVLYCFGG